MPFASSPVLVGPNDQIELRYPTPSTWNTTVTFNVQIGEGLDPNGVTVGTKLPDAQPNFFTFNDNAGSTLSTASLPGDFVSTFQRDTIYYSNAIAVAGIELRVPIKINSFADGPKSPSFPNLAGTAAYSINNGPYINEADSFRTFTGNTTNGSKTITNFNASGTVVVGMYVSSPRITGEIIGISGSTVTLVEPASSSGSTSGQVYFTVQDGDTVRLRVRTEDWYTTNSNVTLTISDNYWSSGDERSNTWSITTREQDQTVSTLEDGTFVDYVDVNVPEFGDYKTTSFDIVGIDADVIIEAQSTGDIEISLDESTWVQNIEDLTFGDTVFVRTFIGNDYTTKTSGNLEFFANPGQTLAGGFENNIEGTWGAGSYARTQVAGTTEDNQQIWTEVDRYPDPISLSPIFTFSDVLPKVDIANGGAGYINNNVYATNAVTGGGSGLTIRTTSVIGGAIGSLEIVERGSGYTENDIIEVLGGTAGSLCDLIVIQYITVNVSTTNVLPNAEIDRTYYCNIPITGLGVEYPAGTYNDLEAPLSFDGSSPTLPIDTSDPELDGAIVQIGVRVTLGSGEIRKNGAGTWVQQLVVTEGDILNFRIDSPSTYNTSITSSIQIDGPPDGGPAGNPTLGPNPPTFPDLTDTITIQTREARTTPYPFRADPIFNAEQGQPILVTIPIDGLDANSVMQVVSETGTSASTTVSSDNTFFGPSVTVPPTADAVYIQAFASNNYGGLAIIEYKIGDQTDFLYIRTEKEDYTYQDFPSNNSSFTYALPQWSDQTDIVLIGAGGGNGGDDAPNSFGGRGGLGNLLAGTINLAADDWPDPNTREVRIWSGIGGGDGADLTQGAPGGAGGFGYATGGDGGDGSATEYSGGGGGGGGATAIEVVGLGIIAVAGGGGGGGGAGADTIIQRAEQQGNQELGGGGLQTDIATIDLTGDPGETNVTRGGGGGGAGGGWGDPGAVNNQFFDLNTPPGLLATTDLDADGGTGGGWYFTTALNAAGDPIFEPLSGIQSDEYGAGSSEGGSVLVGFPPQDRDPDPFSITPISNATPFELRESEYVQITGITGTVNVGIVSNGFSQSIRVCDAPGVNCGAWGDGATIQNGQYIQVRMATGGLYNLTYTATVTVGNLSVLWTITNGPPPDDDPTAFGFTDLFDQPVDTLIESEVVIISGINVPINVTASNGAELRVGDDDGFGGITWGPWVISDPGDLAANQAVIFNNQALQIRLQSSVDFVTTVSTTVAANTISTTWSITTEEAPDLTPDTFGFITLVDQPPLTTVFSNYAEITDISEPITFTVDPDPVTPTEQAFLEINGIQTGNTTALVSEFDLIRLYYLTSDVPGLNTTFPVTAGTLATTWTVITEGDFGTTPDQFVFGTVIAPNPVEITNSPIITLSGITAPEPNTNVNIFGNNGVLLSINGGAFLNYTETSPFPDATNGTTIQAQLVSPAFAGFSVVADVFAGGTSASFTVVTAAQPQDPILGQWYSSLAAVVGDATNRVKLENKTDGLPVGTMMPILKNSVGSTTDTFGEIDGDPDSRYPGWILCNGQVLNPLDYPVLFDVIGYTYGAILFGADVFFRLPDLRNKKLVGTGPVNGNSTSSPALSPDFGPAKTTSGRSINTAGSHGGLWYIDTIATPSDQVIPQVNEPPAGLTPTESTFFEIGSVRTTGYENVTGTVEFLTTGEVTGQVFLKSFKQFEIPFHQHEMINGVADPPFKGRIFWGGNGGLEKLFTESRDSEGSGSLAINSVFINLWGFATTDIQLQKDDTIDTTNADEQFDMSWCGQGCEDDDWTTESGFKGFEWDNETSTMWLEQDGLRLSGAFLAPGSSGTNQSGAQEIDEYINLNSSPFNGFAEGGKIYKWVGAVDIPTKDIPIIAWKPEKLSHTHYLSNTDFGGLDSNLFGYGNSDGPGTVVAGTPNTDTVNVTFNVGDLGLEVLPGEFQLGKSKQLIPTPSLSPQTDVGLITPYNWCRWLIKAY